MMSDTANHNLTIGPNVSLVLCNTNGFYNYESSGVLTISGGISGAGWLTASGAGGNLTHGQPLQMPAKPPAYSFDPIESDQSYRFLV